MKQPVGQSNIVGKFFVIAYYTWPWTNPTTMIKKNQTDNKKHGRCWPTISCARRGVPWIYYKTNLQSSLAWSGYFAYRCPCSSFSLALKIGIRKVDWLCWLTFTFLFLLVLGRVQKILTVDFVKARQRSPLQQSPLYQTHIICK